MPVRASFQHELAGFRYEHEEARHVGVGHRHGAAVAYLLLKYRDDRAVAAQHVAETRGYKLRGLLRAVEALRVNLAQAFRASHDVGRVHRLVGGNHHKLPHAVFHAEVCHYLRAVNIVVDGLGWRVLHHGHVLIGRGVEHVVGAVGLENLVHQLLLRDACHYGLAVDAWEMLAHHQPDVVLRSLGGVDEHHVGGVERRHLPHYLRADASGRARDEYGAVSQHGANGVDVNLYLVSWKKVGNLNLLELARVDFLALVPFLHVFHHVDADVLAEEQVLQRAVLAEIPYHQWRHQHGVYFLVLYHVHEACVV